MKSSKTKTMTWLENLRILMEKAGLNPRSLSLRAGLNPTAVRDMLEGRTRFPRYDTVQSLSKALDITPASLMEPNQNNNELQVQANSTQNDHLDLLIEIIARLQEEAAEAGQYLPPRDFATMAASIYHQMQSQQNTSAIEPKIQDLLAYESMKKRRTTKA